jgi:acetolactate synthase regulatory subunit
LIRIQAVAQLSQIDEQGENTAIITLEFVVDYSRKQGILNTQFLKADIRIVEVTRSKSKSGGGQDVG